MLTADRLRALLSYCPETGIFRWIGQSRRYRGKVAGTIDADGYRIISIDDRAYRAGRLAWLYVTGEWPLHTVDHRNCVRSDDRWDNLRHASQTENEANKCVRKDSKIGLKCVHYLEECDRWRARISCRGKRKYLGIFKTAEEAHAAYISAAKAMFGEFARSA